MALVAGEMLNYPMKAAKRDRVELEAKATITGGAGVVVTPLTVQDDPNITIVRGVSAGLYNITFPIGADGFGVGDIQIVSPAGTVKGFYWTGWNPAAGTGSFQTINAAGAATDPAAGDTLSIQLTLSMRKDF